VEAHAPPRVLKVLFLTIDIRIGGAERLVLELARRLDRGLFAPAVGWFVDEPPPREFKELQIPLFPLRKGPGFDWQAMKALAGIVREHRIDVINAHHFMSFVYSWYAARLASRTGLVYTEHSEADVFSAEGKWRAVGAGLLRGCDAVVGVSDRVSAALRSHFWLDSARVRTIENGVDLDRFAHACAHRADARQELQMPDDAFVIGHVANFRRNKNHLFLLRAFHTAFGDRPGVRLLLIGQGFPGDPENSEPEVRAFIRDHGLQHSVGVLGYRPDVARMLSAMDLFCLVSYKEGLPLSVVEAMATGLPVVVTDIDGLRDIVETEVNGLRVAPDDVAGLAKVLERLFSDRTLRHRLGDNGRQTARARYSFSRCLSQTQDLLASVARTSAKTQ
jgi:glycosyltransferase involved in cell wall biosynthesis